MIGFYLHRGLYLYRILLREREGRGEVTESRGSDEGVGVSRGRSFHLGRREYARELDGGEGGDGSIPG